MTSIHSYQALAVDNARSLRETAELGGNKLERQQIQKMFQQFMDDFNDDGEINNSPAQRDAERAEETRDQLNENRLRGPERGARSVGRMLEIANQMDRTMEILGGDTPGLPGVSRPRSGLGTAVEAVAEDIAINTVNRTTERVARNQLTEQGLRAGLSEEDAANYAQNVIDDATEIRADNPELSPREIAELAIARNGMAFGDPDVDAEENAPGPDGAGGGEETFSTNPDDYDSDLSAFGGAGDDVGGEGGGDVGPGGGGVGGSEVTGGSELGGSELGGFARV